jgi:site-specific DNA-cytosine methylase
LIKLLIGGSPCTYWSIAQKNNRETEPSGLGWELFKNYLIAKEKFKPDFFLYENNKSAAAAIKNQIKNELNVGNSGVRYIEINSAIVSAQKRQRFYVHNCGAVGLPEDRGISLNNVLESGLHFENVGECATLQRAIPKLVKKYGYLPEQFNAYNLAEIKDKSPTLFEKTENGVYQVKDSFIKIGVALYPTKLADGYYIIRKLTVTECCRLQTMPDDYCRAVSNAQGYKGLGNGWTAEVIIHILAAALKDIPKDEEIVVLSMYDGIGTGRYCLDKMGFTNVKYYAYEIDKYAKQVAMSNYPDIIQCGDAFQVRAEDWSIS